MAEHSLLTSTFREVIENEPEPDDYTRKQRMRMRERVTQGLHDLAIINQYARADDIEQIFHRKDTDQRSNRNQYEPDGRDEYLKMHWVPAYHGVALFWRGLRANGMSKDDIFRLIIRSGIEQGEAQFNGVSRGAIESEISLNKLKMHTGKDDMDALEKWKLDLGLTSADMQELHSRLSEHPEVDKVAGEDLNELIERHLIDSDE